MFQVFFSVACVEVSDKEGGAGEVSFRCLNYGASPPSHCHRPQGRERQKEGNVSSLLPWYFKFRGELEERQQAISLEKEEERKIK